MGCNDLKEKKDKNNSLYLPLIRSCIWVLSSLVSTSNMDVIQVFLSEYQDYLKININVELR